MDKFKKLINQYNNFISIIYDDWRGWRLIFNTNEVRECRNKCSGCSLYQLLEQNKMLEELCLANDEDKKIFGPQNFLNCKTLKQYQSCYTNFILQKTNTKYEVESELNLLKNVKIVYAKKGNRLTIEEEFKKEVISEVLEFADKNKISIIKNYLVKNKIPA